MLIHAKDQSQYLPHKNEKGISDHYHALLKDILSLLVLAMWFSSQFTELLFLMLIKGSQETHLDTVSVPAAPVDNSLK